MAKPLGLLGKFTRAFWIQVGLITIAAIVGVFLAKVMIEETLVKNALLQEAEYFWEHYRGDGEFNLPDSRNLTAFFDPKLLPPIVQAEIPTEPGFYEFSDHSNQLVLHVSREQQQILYLVYYRGQVDALVLYYGLVPLLVVLTILYLTLWLAYRYSRRTISPLTRLAKHINAVDLANKDLTLLPDEPGGQGDDEIQVLADAIAHLGERLNAFVTRERNFTRNASHEFRTPLTVINIAVDMMLIENNLPEKSNKSLLRIKRAVYDMENLTEVFLLLAREDAGSMTQKDVDVNQVVRSQIERSDFLNRKKNVEVLLNENSDLRVQASEVVIAVVIGNLIRNAIIYTEQGEVRIDVDQDQLTIVDNGPGIPKSSIDSIFEPFQRAGNEASPGYGVGLTIVKRLCDQFGWDIHVSSEGSGGTCFRVRFREV